MLKHLINFISFIVQIVLTEIHPKNAKQFIQIAGHKTFNTMVLMMFGDRIIIIVMMMFDDKNYDDDDDVW